MREKSAWDELLEAAKLAEAWESGNDVGPMTSDEVLRRLRSAIAKVDAMS